MLMKGGVNDNSADAIARERSYHEEYYKRAFLSHAKSNFQVPAVWIDRAKNPTSRPLDYWEYAFHLLGNLQGKKVAELGCGDGWITTCLASAGANVFAFDISLNGCRLTREKLKAHGLSADLVAVIDAYSMAFKSSSFDAVFIAGVLHHLDIDKVSKEVHRVLKEGGMVVCYEPLKYGTIMWAIRKIWLHLNGLKEYVWTDDEKSLELEDFAPFKSMFRSNMMRRFNFLAKTNRLNNCFGTVASFLRWIDYLILSAFPFLKRFCTCVVCRFEK
jgi:ubiquinone/menaquinone biosynthesis C-methylase UbiE